MNDTLAYFALDPMYRRWHHQRITFAMMYAYSEPSYCLSRMTKWYTAGFSAGQDVRSMAKARQPPRCMH